MDMKAIYNEFESHLLEDIKPSEYFNKLLKEVWFTEQQPFKALSTLQGIEQSPKHHPEGNVWIHTMMVLDNAAMYKNRSKNPKVFMWAALLHDLGKAPTTKIRDGKITAYNHDVVGEGLVIKFLKHLTYDDDFINQVAKLVRWHMQILFVAKGSRFASLKQLLRETDYQEVALIGMCDRLGRGELNQQKISEVNQNIEDFIKKCEEAKNNG